MENNTINYVMADEALKRRIAEQWGDKAAQHMHIEGGFSIVGLCRKEPIALVSVCWKKLAPPLADMEEGYIDIIEVREGWRRRGIATQLINVSLKLAKDRGAHQLRTWSSEDKQEAISMWRALRFGLYPADIRVKDQEVRGYFVTKTVT